MNGEQPKDEAQPVAENEHVAPHLQGEAFHCMHCGVLAQQLWQRLNCKEYSETHASGFWRCTCRNCAEVSIWKEQDGRCVDPVIGGGPRPHVEMPEDVEADYEEARRIVGQSPRGACALLRLAVQKLCDDLGESGKSLNGAIASLVEKGLPVEMQEALDSLRVIGNSAVHPGELDLTDDIETATALFSLLNFVVQDRIAAPKERQTLFTKLPERARTAIKRRDRT